MMAASSTLSNVTPVKKHSTVRSVSTTNVIVTQQVKSYGTCYSLFSQWLEDSLFNTTNIKLMLLIPISSEPSISCRSNTSTVFSRMRLILKEAKQLSKQEMLLNRSIAFQHELVNVSTGCVIEVDVRTVHSLFVWRVKNSSLRGEVNCQFGDFPL